MDKMLINVDTTVATMYPSGPMIDVFCSFLGLQDYRDLAFNPDDPRDQHDLRDLARHFRGVKITVKTVKPYRTKTVANLVFRAGYFQFDYNGSSITVDDYLKLAHLIHIRHPKLIGVQLATPRGTQAPVQIVPLELCDINPRQFFKRPFPERYRDQALKFSTKRPEQRLEAIMSSEGPLPQYTTSQYIVESGMRIDTEPLRIQGRLLHPPTILSREHHADVDRTTGKQVIVPGEEISTKPQNGAWAMHRLHSPARVNVWVASFCPTFPPSQLERHMLGLIKCCREYGMTINKPADVYQGNDQNPEATLYQILDDARSYGVPTDQLLIVVIMSRRSFRARIKNWSDVRTGVRTQCLLEEKVRRANDMYWKNVGLKVNARMGGKNFLVRSKALEMFSSGPGMIMGADVGHPGPGVSRPSLASLVWSVDKFAVSYRATARIQPPRLEQIESLWEMAATAFYNFLEDKSNRFRDGTAAVPKRVFFFRDGLSEGEFERVGRMEVEDVVRGFQAAWARYVNVQATQNGEVFRKNFTKEMVENAPVPKITYVVVGKRHHVAFFPETGSPAYDRKTGNCVAGFVADHELANPLSPMGDFYLQSHQAIQGTSRSSHYTVIQDQNGVATDEKGQVDMRRSVLYRDLLVRELIRTFRLEELAFSLCHVGSTTSGGPTTFSMDAWNGSFRKINDKIQNTMYFL
ncbi:hypothetical protein V5O48_006089 [Marasmius crinis-equi]|uniref:Piwi domain-containing protein n=1 Tax=Marasmius crinis-equi TaxID=585013 RepID=A0ABR3FKG6_9AGAR